METNWVKVYTLTDAIRTELYKQFLEENGIPAVVLNKQDSAFKFGKIELYVSDVNFNEAVLLLANNFDIVDEN
ncbi:DUF2007 domain-containing protein [Sphingobacterium sp. UT-1RO-CII-1]|uniref:putative signal transducing protein n=1 Tax=Sphingobacterium sp. UT-1RO-CII-1 TaxID=2995225 RepID=UPI00227B57C7|nr:DUF2007 domain-containing protein [Sphingobacterium sp. UT-1RO-CII-1]MCY4778737.1 DUF2007 domain-containing protein [Sphingobacterium sp. UT-1RO-CII-1]